MTLTEIKQWYIEEVNKHIATGIIIEYQSSNTLEDYQKDVNRWTRDIFKEKTSFIKDDYRKDVEFYNTPETQEFYKSKKKLFDFIKEYQEKNKVQLNFSNWDDVEVETITTTEAPTTSKKEEDTTSIKIEKDTTTFVEDTTTIEVDTDEENKEDENENGLLETLKNYWYVSIIIVVLLVGGIVLAIRNKNKIK